MWLVANSSVSVSAATNTYPYTTLLGADTS
jgi:hypothetical protein